MPLVGVALESEQDDAEEEEEEAVEEDTGSVLDEDEAVVKASEVVDGEDDPEAGQAGKEFTDKKHESQFCLETNIPAEGDQDGADEPPTQEEEGRQ